MKPTVSGRAGKLWHAAHLLKLALRCMQAAQPIRWREVPQAMRKSRAERRRIIRDLKRELFYGYLCALDGVKP